MVTGVGAATTIFSMSCTDSSAGENETFFGGEIRVGSCETSFILIGCLGGDFSLGDDEFLRGDVEVEFAEAICSVK